MGVAVLSFTNGKQRKTKHENVNAWVKAQIKYQNNVSFNKNPTEIML